MGDLPRNRLDPVWQGDCLILAGNVAQTRLAWNSRLEWSPLYVMVDAVGAALMALTETVLQVAVALKSLMELAVFDDGFQWKAMEEGLGQEKNTYA